MKSPFPGFDPYLQRHWPSVHGDLIVYIRNALQPLLPPGLVATSQAELVAFEETTARSTRFLPDASVIRFDPPVAWSSAEDERPGGVQAAEPIIVIDEDEGLDRWVQIVDVTKGKRVVTAFEVISPKNKDGGEGTMQYRNKQSSYLKIGVNLVELDFIRGGTHIVAASLGAIGDNPKLSHATCVLCVSRATRPGQHEVYPASTLQPLPAIAIPLRPGDKDVVLDVQAVFDQVFYDGRYFMLNDYAKPLRPALEPDEATWLAEQLAARAASITPLTTDPNHMP